jgi:hypothetical protein
MESNSDKQLREKLSSTEFPFDPKAWEQMEAMLDEKKKRRGFFWWWTGGIAAALLLVVFGYELREIVGNKEKIEVSKQPAAIAITNSELPITKEGNSNAQSAIGILPEEGNGKNEKPKATNLQSALNTTTASPRKSHLKKSRGSTVLINANPSSPRHLRSIVFSKKKHNKLALHKFTNEESTTGYLTKVENPFKKEIEMLNAASAKNTADESITLNRKESSLLESVSENAEAGFDKKENEDLLSKKKKKIFNYSLGVLANVTGTTLGKQQEGSMFYNKPSYMVGFTHDFLFMNRIAITNSILFSQTSFKVYSPKTVSFSKSPSDYTSNITELTIPIGIKVYPVVKNNFRFYVNAGIINHIKLKETFTYNMPLDTPSRFVATGNLADVNTSLPAQTDFTGNGYPYEKLNSAGITSTKQVNTNDFSINQAKRYYISFYASAGVEFIIKKHLVLFTEPMFYMSLQKIGVQEKRKYNFGLTGGFRYQF